MKAELIKTGKAWMILITREDGTHNDYRFGTKPEAKKWAKLAGIQF